MTMMMIMMVVTIYSFFQKWIQSLVLLLSTPVLPMNDTRTTSRSRPPVNGDMVLAPKKGVPIPPTDPRLHSTGQGSYYILPPTSASPVRNYATPSPPPTTTSGGFVYNLYGTFTQGILAPPPPSSYNFQTEHATSIPIASGPIIAPPTVKHVHGFQNGGDGRVETHNIDLRSDASMTNAANVGQSPGMRGRHSDNRAKHVGIQQMMSGDRKPVSRTALQRDNAEIYSKPTKNREPNAKCSFSVKPSSEIETIVRAVRIHTVGISKLRNEVWLQYKQLAHNMAVNELMFSDTPARKLDRLMEARSVM